MFAVCYFGMRDKKAVTAALYDGVIMGDNLYGKHTKAAIWALYDLWEQCKRRGGVLLAFPRLIKRIFVLQVCCKSS